jgi:hypothetical protein
MTPYGKLPKTCTVFPVQCALKGAKANKKKTSCLCSIEDLGLSLFQKFSKWSK